MNRRGWLARASLLVALCLSAAACTKGVAASAAAPATNASASNDLTFDLWLGEEVDFIDYAIRELNAECMAKAGYPQLQQAGNQIFAGSSRKFMISIERFRGFKSEADARAKGFGSPQHAELPPVISNDPAFDKQLDECWEQTYAALGSDSKSTLEAYNELGNEMSGEFAAWSRGAIRASLPPLVDCLEEAGFRVSDRDYFINKLWDIKLFGIPLGKLDGEPYSWKPSRKPGTVEVGPPIPELEYVPSSEEADLAAAWYRCDQATGRVDRLMAEARAVQPRIVANFASRFAELNPRLEQVAKTAEDLVGKP